jgi:L-fuculose-phosphate aldolase
MSDKEAREKVVDAGIRLVKSGLIARTWGNVSCRISDSQFVISPSGRDYLSLTPDEIVAVGIADLSYTGDIKPSSEKGVHAEIYKHFPGVNFIIHTHQENASVVSAIGLDSIKADSQWLFLGNEIICASYGLPGTKKLRKGISDALNRTKGNVVIMRNHGAVCFGGDEEEAFQAASDLEATCIHFIEDRFRKINNDQNFDADKMRQYALSKIDRKHKDTAACDSVSFGSSERTADGFVLHINGNEPIHVKFGYPDQALPREAKIHSAIYSRNPNINCILHTASPDVLTLSRTDTALFPFVDDFAQIVGTRVITVPEDPDKIARALKSASAVMIRNNGALCCGATEGDASAVLMIMEKNCKAEICGTLFGDVKPLSRLDSKLMRFVYLKKYSKQISSNNNSKSNGNRK